MTNYHAHTPRCKHASGTEEAYALAAIQSGYQTLGFSDHTPWPYENGYVGTYRMPLSDFPSYKAAVADVKAKFAGQIDIRFGLECEYFPAYMNWLREFKEEQGLEYLLLGNHHDTTDDGGAYMGGLTTPKQVRRGADMLLRGMDTGLYLYVAHPDLIFRSYPDFDVECEAVSRDICRAAKDMNLPLEYNLLGAIYGRKQLHPGLGYPCARFWEIAARENAPCVVGVDAHSPAQLEKADSYVEARAHLTELGLHPVETLI